MTSKPLRIYSVEIGNMSKDYYYGKEAKERIWQFKVVKIDEVNWCTYYIDENTNEKFVEIYLESHLQGGVPPRLIKIYDFPFSF